MKKNQDEVREVPVSTYNYLQLSLVLTADVKYKKGKHAFYSPTNARVEFIKTN